MEQQEQELGRYDPDDRLENGFKNLQIKLLQVSEYVNPSIYYDIKSEHKIIGSVIVFVKKAIRKMLAWLLIPFSEKIALYQKNNTEYLAQLLEFSEIMKDILSDIKEICKIECDKHKNSQIQEICKIAIEKQDNLEKIQNMVVDCKDEILDYKRDIIDCKNDLLIYKMDIQNIKDNIKYITQDNDNIMQEYKEIAFSIAESKPEYFEHWFTRGRNEGFMSYSQSGEDGIVNFILFTILKKEITDIMYFDIGCNHYKDDNNTYHLYRRGAYGIIVDANPTCVEQLRSKRPRDIVLNIGIVEKGNEEIEFYILNNYGLSSFSRESILKAQSKNPEIKIERSIVIKTKTINDLFNEYFCPEKVVLLSLDVEGIDLAILQSLDSDRFRPELIIVEAIEYAPWVVVEENRENLVSLMKNKGYAELAFTGVNSIFIDKNFIM